MKQIKSTQTLGLSLTLALPLFISGCQPMGSMFNEQNHHYPYDHRPVDIYENDRDASRRENANQNRSYSITNQQGRTYQQSKKDEEQDRQRSSVPVTPPSVPGTAPKLAE